MRFTIPDLRKSRNLTQRELATDLSKNNEGITFSPSSIAQYELGLRTPNLKRAHIIAKYFNVTIESIIFGSCAHEMRAKEKTA